MDFDVLEEDEDDDDDETARCAVSADDNAAIAANVSVAWCLRMSCHDDGDVVAANVANTAAPAATGSMNLDITADC